MQLFHKSGTHCTNSLNHMYTQIFPALFPCADNRVICRFTHSKSKQKSVILMFIASDILQEWSGCFHSSLFVYSLVCCNLVSETTTHRICHCRFYWIHSVYCSNNHLRDTLVIQYPGLFPVLPPPHQPRVWLQIPG